MSHYAKVVVDRLADKLDKPFTYTIPAELREEIQLGLEVSVPFRNRQVSAYVIAIEDEVETGDFKIKAIKAIKSRMPLFDAELLTLAKWMADYYQCFLITALKAIMPGGKRKIKTKRVIELAQSKTETKEVIAEINKRAPKQSAILKHLLDNQENLTATELSRRVDTSPGTVRRLVEKGLVTAQKKEVKRRPYTKKVKASTKLNPTPDQKKAIDKINYAAQQKRKEVFLLKGITGSGKTEVYLQTISDTLKQGGEAIVLVPEISLTPQTVERFRARFGDQIAVLHSQLSTGERFDEWRRIKEGGAKVVIGARSAIFAPLDSLELIIIDEEHESTYKQEDNPKYHARKVACKRAELNNAVVVLGSATPDLTSYHKALNKDYKLLELPNRINGKKLPKVEVIDMREELKAGNKKMFSRDMQQELNHCLENDEQAIIFLNRRGFSTFVQCRECGHVMECENCDVSLTYHTNPPSLQCHYCNYKLKVPDICPDCESRYIKYFGVGTQKVEQGLNELYPKANVVRIDRDTMTKKGAYRKLFNKFKSGVIDILVGTQMLAKGHDFPNVTLVGVVAADITLNLPDFRASENTFQLLTQVAGRTGRGSEQGKVIIQSYTPEHYSIDLAKEHNYKGFYQQEIKTREEMFYPPFAKLISILIKGEREAKVIKTANYLGEIIRERLSKEDTSIMILGPAKAPLAKIKGNYRWQLILKGELNSELKYLCREVISTWWKNREAGVQVSVDIDPARML